MDSIFSVRINEELKEKFFKMAQEQGINNKDLMEVMVKHYELNDAKDSFNYAQNDIDELQSITKRVLDIYINLLEKSKIKSLEVDNTYKKALTSKEELFNKLSSEKQEVEDKFKEFKKQLEECNKEITKLKEEVKKEKDIAKEVGELNKLLKDKNEMLQGQLSNFEDFQEENKVLEEKIINFKEEISNIRSTYESLKNQLILNQDESSKKEKDFKATIDSLEENYNEELRKKQEELDFKIAKESLAKETYFREEIWNLKTQYEDRISTLLKEKEELYIKLNDLVMKSNK